MEISVIDDSAIVVNARESLLRKRGGVKVHGARIGQLPRAKQDRDLGLGL
jgi:hypothetical protein